jgi:hypothetical protein
MAAAQKKKAAVKALLRKPSGRHLESAESGPEPIYRVANLTHPRNWLTIYKAIQKVLAHQRPDLVKSKDAKKYPFRTETFSHPKNADKVVVQKLQHCVVKTGPGTFKVKTFQDQVPFTKVKSVKEIANLFTSIRKALGKAITDRRIEIEAISPIDNSFSIKSINPKVWLGNTSSIIFETGLLPVSRLKKGQQIDKADGHFLAVFLNPVDLDRLLEPNSSAVVNRGAWLTAHMQALRLLTKPFGDMPKEKDWYAFCVELSVNVLQTDLSKGGFEKLWTLANKGGALSPFNRPRKSSSVQTIKNWYVESVKDEKATPDSVADSLEGRIAGLSAQITQAVTPD